MTTESPLDPVRAALGHAVTRALAAMAKEPFTMTGDQVGRLLEKPPELAMGDYALPCFRFAKPLGRKPQEIAEALATALTQDSEAKAWVTRTQVVGAFLNLFVDQERVARLCLPEVMGGTWFRSLEKDPVANATRVMIEYSQPNTHKEFHVGHARNAFLGSALIKIFRYCGYQVIAANYFGDEGTHIAKCLWHINRTKATPPATGRGTWLGEKYAEADRLLAEADEATRKEYEKEISAVLAAIESKSGPIYEQWRKTRQWSLDAFEEIYARYHCEFDVRFHESDVSAEAQEIVDEYYKKGVFIEDQGAIGVDLKPYKLGFCILRKRDGNTLYATKDLALARRKFEDYRIDRSLYVVAGEQDHHFRQVFKVLELMGFEQATKCHHVSYGLVVLPDGKMSSRAGTAVSFYSLERQMAEELDKILEKYRGEWPEEEIRTARDRLLEGAMKYGMLSTDPAKQIVFNMADWLSFEGDSGPYLMYSYTRVRSILRKASEQGHEPATDSLNELRHESERELVRFIYDFNDVVKAACENYKPSLIANHLFAMCKAFNRFYSEVSVLKAETDAARSARLALVAAFGETLRQGLALLGITPPERM